jgi:transcriptional regulator with XRE-family HTH domain
MGAVGFGERLAWARRRCGLSMAQLSRTAGYCKNTLRSYERGLLRGGPPLNTVEELAQTLGVLQPWLAFGVGSVDQRPALWARVRSRLDEIDSP